jgi:hypothetical protein
MGAPVATPDEANGYAASQLRNRAARRVDPRPRLCDAPTMTPCDATQSDGDFAVSAGRTQSACGTVWRGNSQDLAEQNPVPRSNWCSVKGLRRITLK